MAGSERLAIPGPPGRCWGQFGNRLREKGSWGEIAGNLCRATLRGLDLLCRIPFLRCVHWNLRRRLLRGNARYWEGAVPIDPASEIHGSRNRQETSNRAYEQCIILESQQ